jgi:hypothetical protein
MRLCRHIAALAEFSGGSGFCETVQREDLFFLLMHQEEIMHLAPV